MFLVKELPQSEEFSIDIWAGPLEVEREWIDDDGEWCVESEEIHTVISLSRAVTQLGETRYTMSVGVGCTAGCLEPVLSQLAEWGLEGGTWHEAESGAICVWYA